jgi:hypothetical protein
MALNKDRLSHSIVHQCGFSKIDSQKLLEGLIEIIKSTPE